MKILAALLLMTLSSMAYAAVTTAAELSTSCQSASRAVKGKESKYDSKHPADIYAAGQCEGYLQGWLEEIDGKAFTQNGKPVIATVKWSQVPNSMFTIAAALAKHLKDVPLDAGKPAAEVLRDLIYQNDLLTMAPYSDPCPEDVKHPTAYMRGGS